MKKGGQLLGPSLGSQAAALAPLLSPSFQMLLLLYSILNHESDHDSFCDSPL